MDVEIFVKSVLEQVTKAVIENESTLHKPDRNSPIEGVSYVYDRSGSEGWATTVEFDIAVTSSVGSDGGAKLSIPGVGSIGGDMKNNQESTSRVKFKVPIKFTKQIVNN